MSNLKRHSTSIKICILIVVFFSEINISARNYKITSEQKDVVQQNQKSQILGFQENKGQMADIYGKPVPNVLFKAEIPNLNIWITTNGLTYQFFDVKEYESDEKYAGDENDLKVSGKKAGAVSNDKLSIEWSRVDMILKGASIRKENIRVEGDITNCDLSYFLGHCPQGIFDVRTYKKIIIKEVYPGIDWVLHTSSHEGIKHDFVVHPGSDPDRIKLIYEGNGIFDIKDDQINFENKLGGITEGKLFSYQESESQVISSHYIIIESERKINNGFSYQLGIQLGAYDSTRSITIDPQLTWSTFFGGSGTDGPMSIDADASGNIFIAGYVGSVNFPVVNPGAPAYYQGTNSGANVNENTFISKFSSAGVLLWSTYYGGFTNSYPASICVDPAGNVFISGYTWDTNLPVLNPFGGAYFQGTNAGGGDAFVLKFTNGGQRLWATYYGGSGNDQGFSVFCDATGNLFITGRTASLNFPVQNPFGGAYFQGTIAGGATDAFILKFNNTGVRIWATYYGGSGSDAGFGICCDPAGNIFATGNTASTNFPVQNTGTFFQGANLGTSNVFVLKCSNAGVLIWATYYGGSGGDSGNSICSDLSGNIFVTGTAGSVNFPVLNPLGGVYFQGAKAGLNDQFVLKFSNTGVRLWATYFGGSGTEGSSSYNNIEADYCGNVYVSFETNSTDLFTFGSQSCGQYFDNTFNGNKDIFILKFNNSGVALLASYLGGNSNDFREALTVDNSGNFYITGEWTGSVTNSTYPLINPGMGAFFDPTHNGMDDGYIVKFSPTAPVITQSQINSASCSPCNGSATVNIACANPNFNYTWSNGSQTLSSSISTNTITGLCPGNYSVTVTDSICVIVPYIATFVITGTACGSLTVNVNSVTICSGAVPCPTLTANTASGTQPYTYSWSTGATTQNINPCPPVTTTYTVTVTDNGGNAATSTAVVTVNPAVTVTATSTNITCNGKSDGSVTSTPGGGTPTFNYVWSNGITTSSGSNLATGNYTVTVIDSKGCTASSTTTITAPPALIGQYTKGTANCSKCGCKEWIMVNATGGTSPYSYLWSDGYVNKYKNQLCPGAYLINIKDKNGCSVTINLTTP